MGLLEYFDRKRAEGLIPKGEFPGAKRRVNVKDRYDEKIPVADVADQAEAQAMANFLWNEKCRHQEDVQNLLAELDLLNMVWSVVPEARRRFVKILPARAAGFKPEMTPSRKAELDRIWSEGRWGRERYRPGRAVSRESEPTPGELDVLEHGFKKWGEWP
jgi:hypothetical protein